VRSLPHPDAAAKAYRAFYRKTGEAAEGYEVSHPAYIYLMNPKGELARPLTHELTPDQIAQQIGDAMAQRG